MARLKDHQWTPSELAILSKCADAAAAQVSALTAIMAPIDWDRINAMAAETLEKLDLGRAQQPREPAPKPVPSREVNLDILLDPATSELYKYIDVRTAAVYCRRSERRIRQLMEGDPPRLRYKGERWNRLVLVEDVIAFERPKRPKY